MPNEGSMSFPKFPTLFELAALEEAPPPQRRQQGLFEMYLRKQPEHILQDARTRAAVYPEEVLSLLTDLYEGRKKWDDLPDPSKKLLDEASLEFLSPTHAPEPKAKKPEAIHQPRSASVPRETPVTGPHVDPFWWTR